jgi:hypothetical protein
MAWGILESFERRATWGRIGRRRVDRAAPTPSPVRGVAVLEPDPERCQARARPYSSRSRMHEVRHCGMLNRVRAGVIRGPRSSGGRRADPGSNGRIHGDVVAGTRDEVSGSKLRTVKGGERPRSLGSPPEDGSDEAIPLREARTPMRSGLRRGRAPPVPRTCRPARTAGATPSGIH